MKRRPSWYTSIRIKRGISLCNSFPQANTLSLIVLFFTAPCVQAAHAHTIPMPLMSHPHCTYAMPMLHSYHTLTTQCHAPTAPMPHPHYTRAMLHHALTTSTLRELQSSTAEALHKLAQAESKTSTMQTGTSSKYLRTFVSLRLWSTALEHLASAVLSV